MDKCTLAGIILVIIHCIADTMVFLIPITTSSLDKPITIVLNTVMMTRMVKKRTKTKIWWVTAALQDRKMVARTATREDIHHITIVILPGIIGPTNRQTV